jgi:hypothetical protein
MRRAILGGTLAIVLGLAGASGALAQLGGIGSVLRNVPSAPIGNALSGPQPVSTNIRDAIYGDPGKDGFTPRGQAVALTSLPRGSGGGFVLRQGWYAMTAQSYCLHAGTRGPSRGDGYLYAPLKGSAEETVSSILRNSVNHPDIEQRDIQMLLWAIVARAKFQDLDTRLKLVANRLLSKKQLATLNRSALSVLTGPEMSRLTGGLPGPLRAIAEAESRMRGMFAGGSGYADLERVAVLSGNGPRGEGSVDVPSGRWSQHPDGYFVRYRPNGYTNTQVEIWVPPGSAGIGKVYDPAVQVATPGDTGRQRLAQSARAYR